MYNDDLIHFSKSENCKDVSEQCCLFTGQRSLTLVSYGENARHTMSVCVCCLGFHREAERGDPRSGNRRVRMGLHPSYSHHC